MRLSARALEYMCIQNGLNPVIAHYDVVGGDATGLLKAIRVVADASKASRINVLDRAPYAHAHGQVSAVVACYKPRVAERLVPWIEAGGLPAELHPKFALDFGSASSERIDSVMAVNVSTFSGNIRAARAWCTSPGMLIATVDRAARLPNGTVRQVRLSTEFLSNQSYRGVSAFLHDGSERVAVKEFGRC